MLCRNPGPRRQDLVALIGKVLAIKAADKEYLCLFIFLNLYKNAKQRYFSN